MNMAQMGKGKNKNFFGIIRKNIDNFRIFPILIIIIYIPFHILEEAFGNFPDWMSRVYGLPISLNYPHWLINNVFFFGALTVGIIFFLKNDKYIYLGIGILFWAMMNSFEHIIGSLIFMKLSPGFFTGLMFLFTSIIGIVTLINKKKITKRVFAASILSAALYWAIPIGLIVLTGKIWLSLLY